MSPSGALPPLELLCLGPPTARLDASTPPPEVLWPKHLALLIYLALSPERRRTRDHLLGVLWPEKPDAQARHALNESLRRLRAALGPDRLQSVADAVTISETQLSVDALRFTALAEMAPAEAATLLRGDFLEGFSVSGSPPFEEWMHAERGRYQARGAAVLLALGEQRLAASAFADANDLAQRTLALQPYSEPAVRLLMRAVALSGDPGSALAAYHQFADHLQRETGEKASGDLAALAERIRRRSEQPPVPRDEALPPLIGRQAVHQALFAAASQSLRDGPYTIVITGSPGTGRTRLLEECLQRLTLEGAWVARARPLHSDHDAPWSTLRALARSGLHQAPGLVGASPDALAVLASLVPELSSRTSPRQPRDAGEAAHALASVLGALTAEQPVALAIDDAHLADGTTLGALGAALEQLSAAPLILLLTVLDHAEHQPQPLLELRGQLGRALRGSSFRLDPLTPDDMSRLVTVLASWCTDDRERDRLARRLMFESGGNPFFAMTLLVRLQRAATLRKDLTTWPPEKETIDAPLPFSIPSVLNLSVAARVAELEEPARQVVCTASIAGQALDLDLIAQLVERPRSEIEAALPDLERHHLLVFDGERYAFAAPILAEIIRNECLTRGERKTLARRAVAALEPRADLESRTLRSELRAAVEPGPTTFAEAAAVAREALAAQSIRTARRALAAAERAVAEDRSARAGLEQLRNEVLRDSVA